MRSILKQWGRMSPRARPPAGPRAGSVMSGQVLQLKKRMPRRDVRTNR
jgi:hypothetical protein